MQTMARFLLLSLVLQPLAAAEEGPPVEGPIIGFSDESSRRLRDLETRYDSMLDVGNLESWMKRMTTRPHNAGSPKAKENAEFVAGLFREWGFETSIETYHVLFPTPRTRELELVSPTRFTAALDERVVESDSAAEALKAEALPPFNAYSADGDVTGTLVYVNQGLPRDYEELDRRGIDVRGKIVIARYGGSWRGIKPKVAAEHGAIGCIIFNDPRADGYAQGAAYPEGAYKHSTAVQRGSIIDLPLRPGDPLTPFRGATESAERLTVAESETVMKIPTLPISAANAKVLMENMDGPVAPASWRGALPVTYRIGGGGGTRVRLKLEFNWDLVPAYNVIARMEGSDYPDRWIIRGNHHDAWVIGAQDPISGLVALLEQARAFGELAKSGWRPKRTVIFCAWDAEEPGLLGSTEWVEHHADELREKGVVYINTDGNSRGFLSIGGSHALEELVAQVANEVPDPQTGVSIAQRLRARAAVHGNSEQKKWARSGAGVRLAALGSGSDYSAFLQHLGMASLNVSFGGEGSGGEYHTAFDTFDHYSGFKDPGFPYGIALARVCGRLTLRLADAEVLQFSFSSAARTFSGYVDEVVALAEEAREEVADHNRLVSSRSFQLAADPRMKMAEPERQEPVPYLNFAPLLNASSRLQAAAAAYDTALRAREAQASSKDFLGRLNQILYQSERALMDESGLPRRPWFRHRIYAPGFYTGYGVKTLPGVREGIEQRRWEETEQQIGRTTAALNRFSDQVDKATSFLSNTAGR